MLSRMAKTAQAANSSCARIVINQRSCIRKTNVARQRQIKFCLPITNDPVCAELLERRNLPASDLILRREIAGLGLAENDTRVAAWAPWRAYAAVHLWTSPAADERSTP